MVDEHTKIFIGLKENNLKNHNNKLYKSFIMYTTYELVL